MQRISVTRNSAVWAKGVLGEPDSDPAGRLRSGSVGGTPLLNIPESKIASTGQGSRSNLWDYNGFGDSMITNPEADNLELSESHAFYQAEHSNQATPSENPRRLSFETRKMSTLGCRVNYVPSFHPRARLPGTPLSALSSKNRISSRKVITINKGLDSNSLTIGEQTPSQKWGKIQTTATKSQTLGAELSVSHETTRPKIGWTQKLATQMSDRESAYVGHPFAEHTAPMSRFATEIKKTETLMSGRSKINLTDKRCLFIKPQQPGGDSASGIQLASSIRNVNLAGLAKSTDFKGTNDTLKSLLKDLEGPNSVQKKPGLPLPKPLPKNKTDQSAAANQTASKSQFVKRGVQVISLRRTGIQKVIAYESSSDSNASSRHSRQSRDSVSRQKSGFNKHRKDSRFKGDYRTGD